MLFAGEAQMSKQEKRVVPRVGIKWPVTMLSPELKVEGKIENFSSRGAFVSCKELPPLEEGFLMVIQAPHHKAMNLNAKVVWSTVLKTSEGDPYFGIGVQFTRMSPDDRQALHKLIAKNFEIKTFHKVVEVD
jgi:Tfp pilus assembly protein PilZ